MRVNSNVEAADKLAVVQTIVPTAVCFRHAAHFWSEHHDDMDSDNDGGDDDLDSDSDGYGDDESKGSPDDDEAVVIGQNVLLRGKSNRVPGKQSTL